MSRTAFEFTDNIMYLKGVGPRKAAVLEKKLNIKTSKIPQNFENNV